MGFSNEWNDSYKKKRHMSIGPWYDLISIVMRCALPTGSDFLILELGVGTGANIPFFKYLDCTYYAIESSIIITENLKEKYPELKENIVCADFTKEIPFSEKFDLIVDRAAVTHNTTEAIEKTIKNIANQLKPEGKFIGIDWFSTKYSEYKKGDPILNDKYSKTNYKDGPFACIGIVHFSDKEYILKLFNGFEIELLEHKVIKSEIPKDDFEFAS